jgi:hypothetical protein
MSYVDEFRHHLPVIILKALQHRMAMPSHFVTSFSYRRQSGRNVVLASEADRISAGERSQCLQSISDSSLFADSDQYKSQSPGECVVQFSCGQIRCFRIEIRPVGDHHDQRGRGRIESVDNPLKST